MIGYYKPYMRTFLTDMFLAFVDSIIALIIPLAVRYITSNIIDIKSEGSVNRIIFIGIILIGLVLIQFGARFYITNIGHVMGAKMEYDMRSEIFEHYQKLSYAVSYI